MTSSSRLFKPLKVGNMLLQHRAAMAPLTRYRATDEHVPTELMVEYYGQRASVPGTLLITEATFISPQHGGYANVPGIYNDAQVEGWKKVTDAVHAKGSFIVVQLWALGRTANPDVAKKEGIILKSSSAVALDDAHGAPVEMTLEDIKTTIQAYVTAAQNAVRAGFDAVELHGANGYLIDQFTQDTVNQRTDQYGGSIENRSRFAIEATEAVVKAIGADKTAIRLSPWTTFQGMRMAEPIPQFTDVIRKLPKDLAYIHVVEPRVDGNADVGGEVKETNDFALELWNGPYLAAGGFNADNTHKHLDELRPNKDVVAVFGRYFIANPDLPFRLREGIPFTPYNRGTFYIPKSPVGYTDQPFSPEFEKLHPLPN